MRKSSDEKNKKRQNQLNRVRNLIENADYKRAMYEIVKYIATYPDDMLGHYLYGKLLLRKNYLQPARREFQLVVEHQDVNEVKSLMNLATIARLEGDPDEAIGYYRKVIEDSNNTDIYAINTLAHLQRHEKRYEDALNTLGLTPSIAYELQTERAKNLSLLGKIDEALRIMETITPGNRAEERELALNNGRIARAKDDFTQAKFYYEVAKESEEKDSIYYKAVYEEAKLALDYEKYEEAVEHCTELKKAEEFFDGEVYLLLGMAKQSLGKYHQAYTNYQQAAEIATDKDIRSLAYYYVGSLDFASGNLALAETAFKRSLSNSRGVPEKTYTKLIGVLFRQEKYDEVLKYLARLKKVRPAMVENDTPLSYIGLLVAKKNGKKLPPIGTCTYAEKQIINYSQQDAISHIKSHHQRSGRRRGNFSHDIEIEALYCEIKSNLKDENLVNEEAMDIFEIDYPNAGYDLEDNLVHRVRVVVFPRTKNILTMYPGCRATVPRKGELLKTPGFQKVKKPKTNKKTP